MTVKKSHSRRVLTIVWSLAAFAVITVALIISVTRVLMPLLNDHRSEIQYLIQQELGERVEIGSISADWSGLHPAIRLNDVSLYREDHPGVWLQFATVEVSLNVFASIRNWVLEPSKIEIGGASLSVIREDKHRYLVNEQVFDTSETDMIGRDRFLAWLFSRDKISIKSTDVDYQDATNKNKHIVIQDSSFVLENYEHFHRIRGELKVPDTKNRNVSFIIDMTGDYKDPGALVSEFYLDGDVSLGSWLHTWGLSDKQVLGGDVRFTIWGTSSNRKIRNLQGRVTASDLAWEVPGATQPGNKDRQLIADFNQIDGQFFWSMEKNGWKLGVEQFNLTRGENSWPVSDFYIAGNRETKSLQARFGFLRLQDISELVSTLDIMSVVRDKNSVLGKSNIKGDVTDLSMHIQGELPQVDTYFVKGGFSEFSLDRQDSIPGVKGATGKFIANNTLGFLSLDSSVLVADFGNLFRTPINADKLDGDIYWHKVADGWEIESQDLSASNYHVSTRSRVKINSFDDGRSPLLDIQVTFINGDASKTGRYLPTGIMGAEVVSWLDQAIVSGELRTGVMVLRGNAADFPFDKGTGIFDVRFNVENMIFQYATEWPRAEEVAADVNFRGRSLDVDVVSGKILGLDIQPGKVAIADMTNRVSVNMKVGAVGKTSEMLHFLGISPAGEDYADFLSGLKTTGDSTLKLNIELPLDDINKRQVEGSLQLSNSSLLLSERDTEFTDLNGILQFGFKQGKFRFKADNIQSRFRNSDATIKVSTLHNETGQETSIDIRTNMTAASLFGKSAAFMSSYFSGNTNWLASIIIGAPDGNEKNSVELAISSSLTGIAIDLPAGFGKKKAESKDMVVVLSLSEKDSVPLKVDYGDYARGSFRLHKVDQGYVLDKGTLMLGGALAFRGESKGLSIRGNVPRLSVSEWVAWDERTSKKGTTRDISKLVSRAKLQIDELELYDSIFRAITLDASKTESYWDITADSEELAGKFRVPDDFTTTNPIVMDLTRLVLNVPESKNKKALFDPRELPPFRISSQEFIYNEMNLGRLNLQTRREDKGMYIETLNSTTANLELNASGWWVLENAQHTSRFNIKMTSDDLGKALDILQYEGAIAGGDADIDMSVNWAGPPNWFEMQRLNGDMSIRIIKGQMLEVEPGGGRIFGILSVQALPRRLSLDFSDLFKKGFSFDKIEGKFVMSDGNAYTNDLYLEGPAAHIDISGRIGLAEKDYDQSAVVTPRFSSSIPLVGGLAAASPGVGIGLWVADKLFGKDIDKMTRTQYSITGSWENPHVTKESVSSSRKKQDNTSEDP